MAARNLALVCLATALAWAGPANSVRAQYGAYGGTGGVQQVTAHVDDKGMVTIRQFNFVFGAPVAPAPAPKGIAPANKGAVSLQPAPPPKHFPTPNMRETRLRFKANDLHVAGLDGKKVEADVWRKVLAKETAVLFMGHYYGYDKPADIKAPTVPIDLADIYKKDTLVVYGKSQPAERTPPTDVTGDGPKERGPQIILASYQSDKVIRFREHFAYEFYKTMTVGEKDKDGRLLAKNIAIKLRSEGTNTFELPASMHQLIDANGKQLANDRLPELLAKERNVLQSNSGVSIDPFYLRLRRPDALILAVPQPPAVALPAPKSPGV